MAIFKVNKTKNYTIMSNHHLKENEMSLKAKGLLSVMLSLPENWDYSINGLVSLCKENETSINSALKELKDFGYLRVDKLMPNETKTGRIEYVYNIFEEPQEKQDLEKQDLEKQDLENLGVVLGGQLNNKILNNNKEKYNINIIKKKVAKKATFEPPTYEEVLAYATTRNRTDLAKTFYEYFETGNWVDSLGKPVVNWKQKFITWEKNNKKGDKKVGEPKRYDGSMYADL